MTEALAGTALFVVGDELSAAVATVLKGDNVRCAVAFIGKRAWEALKQPAAKIVCNVDGGSTSADGLEKLSEVLGGKLRWTPNLHAKVYLSSNGAVIGSANFTGNGLGIPTMRGARLIEAATVHAADCAVFETASTWFDRLYDDAKIVGDAEIDRARKLFRPENTTSTKLAPRTGSILDLVERDPAAFNDVGFFFTSTKSTQEDIRKAKEAAPDPTIVRDWCDNVFTGWTDDIERIKPLFIEFWRPGERGAEINFDREAVRIQSLGTIFARRDRRSVQDRVTASLPSAKAAMIDGASAAKILGNHANLYLNASELAEALRAMREGGE